MDKPYFIYIMTNQSNRVLYTGITSNLVHRVHQHREGRLPGFTKKYRVKKLVYFEVFDNPNDAIAREKQLKAGSRAKKIALIERLNPTWVDLYDSIR